MNKRYILSNAVFMICLIIMIPMYSSLAMAEISQVRTYDNNKISGFIKSGNPLTVEAYALVSGDNDISTDQVKLGDTFFTSCTAPDPERRFKCMMTIPTEGFLFEKPTHTYLVSLYNDVGGLVDTEPAQFTFDDLTPSFSSIEVPSGVGRSNFNINYSVLDPVNADNGCSGIGGINIYLNNAPTPFVTELINTSACFDQGSIEILGNDLDDGENTLSFTVFDRVSHESSQMSKSVDAELSDILIQTIEIQDADKNTIKWFVPGTTEGTLVVIFSGPELEFNTIKADLSQLNPSHGIESPSRCLESNYETTCEWEVLVDIENPISAGISFTMQDYADNSYSKTMPLNLFIDTLGPRVTSLRSATSIGDMNYANPTDTEFIARISENAILDENKIKLYLGDSSKGTDNFFVKATSCEEISNANWECKFSNISLTALGADEYQAYILTDSKDKFDNAFTNSITVDFLMDDKIPEIIDVKVRAISGVTGAERTFIHVRDSLEISVILKEDNAMGLVYADLSNIISGKDYALGSCAKEGEDWICRWETDIIDISQYTDTDITLYLTDGAGNKVVEIVPITLMDVEESQTAIWGAEVTLSSPSAIDRQIVTFYEPSIWKGIQLSPTDSSIIPTEIIIEQCVNTESDNESLDDIAFLADYPEIYNYNTIDTPASSSYPIYLKFKLIQAAPENQTNLNITCTMNIHGIKDRYTVVYSPSINVSFSIDYFNNPIGTVDKSVNDEIENIKNGWLVSADWIGSLNKMLSYGKMVCGIVNVWLKITNLFGIIKDIFTVTCSAKPYGQPTCPMSGESGIRAMVTKQRTNTLYEMTQPFCKAINCQYSSDSEVNGKGTIMKSVDVITGNSAWAKKLKGSGKDRSAWFGNLNTEPQGSLILSILYLCIPGVIYNLQKARAIDCVYINCLKQVDNGMPVNICTSQRGYAYCKYVYGEIFHLIPFASAISTIGQNVMKALSHPLELIGFVFNIVCSQFCSNLEGPPLCGVCTVAEFFKMTMDVLCDLGIGADKCTPIWENLEVKEGACESALS